MFLLRSYRKSVRGCAAGLFSGLVAAMLMVAAAAMTVTNHNNSARMEEAPLNAHSQQGTLRLQWIAGVKKSQDPHHADDDRSASSLSEVSGMAMGQDGRIYFADYFKHAIKALNAHGEVSLIAGSHNDNKSMNGDRSEARFQHPHSIAINADGEMFITDAYAAVIRKIDAAGRVTTLAGNAGVAGHHDAQGEAARFENPQGIAIDKANNLYVTDAHSLVRKISPAGEVTTLAGNYHIEDTMDGKGSKAKLNNPIAITYDALSNALYVAEFDGCVIRKITLTGEVSTLAGKTDQCSSSADGVGTQARFAHPLAITADRLGNLWVADFYGKALRRLSPAGRVTSFLDSMPKSDTNHSPSPTAIISAQDSLLISTHDAIYRISAINQ